MDYLLQNAKIVPAVVPSAGSVAAMTPVEVDARGFGRALFIIATGAAATNGTLDAKIQKSETSGGDLADITGAEITQLLAATGASKVVAVDVTVDPAKPFMKVTGAVGTATFANSVTCVLYGGSGLYPKSAPATEALYA